MFKFLVFLFLCLIFLQPERGINGTKEGLLLWYQAVLPAQLPFVMGVQLLLRMISLDKMSPILLNFVAGLIAGYPTGSMTTAKLYKEGRIAESDLTLMAAFSNMAGPLFVIGTVGTILLENIWLGYILLMVHWTSAVVLIIVSVWREKKRKRGKIVSKSKRKESKKQILEKRICENQTIGGLLADAAGETAQLMLKIACFIVMFSVLKQWAGGVIGALLEMSGGIQWLVGQEIDIKWKLVGCSFLINFSGCCVILQSLGTVGDVPVSAFGFMCLKIIQGILAAVIMLVICQILIL